MAQRRLAILCSHLLGPNLSQQPPRVASIPCCSGDGGSEAEEGGGGDKGCIFCSIVRGESPAFKLYEDDICLCILDSSPLTFGHSLIIPKSHFPSLEATPPYVVAAMCSKVPFLSRCIMRATQSDSFNLLVNNGSVAGQVIFHTHLHIIPRKADDKLWRSDSSTRQEIKSNEETFNLVNAVREIVAHSHDKFDGKLCQLPEPAED